MTALFYHMLMLLASPAPDLQAQLMAALDEAHDCNIVAMDKRNCAALSGLVDKMRAPLLEIVECGAKRAEKIRNGIQARTWAYYQCGNPLGRKLTLTLDEKGRMRKIQFICE